MFNKLVTIHIVIEEIHQYQILHWNRLHELHQFPLVLRFHFQIQTLRDHCSNQFQQADLLAGSVPLQLPGQQVHYVGKTLMDQSCFHPPVEVVEPDIKRILSKICNNSVPFKVSRHPK